MKPGTMSCIALVAILAFASGPAAAEALNPQQQLAFDIYKELVENQHRDRNRRHRPRSRGDGGAAAGGGLCG
jgi:hypothetical protein